MGIDRRTFMKLGGAGIVGVAFASLVNGCEDYSVTPLGASGAPFLTPIDLFFVQNGGQGSITQWAQPSLTQDTWQLKIEGFAAGDVGNPMTITYNDVVTAAQAGNEVTILKTIQCVLESPLKLTPTGFMGNAYWTGVPLKFFLDKAEVNPAVLRLLFYGADGFTNNITYDRIINGDAQGLLQPLLVYKMNGIPLTPDHGHPIRLIVQEGYGYKNVKWLTRIQATKFDVAFGTYQDQGYVDDGIISVNSRSTVIREGAALSAGKVEISGYAVSGSAPVNRVEIRIDGGSYQAAEIVPLSELSAETPLPATIKQITDSTPFPFRSVWTKWRFVWDAPAGNHAVSVRATDAAGNAQPEVDGNPFDGKTGVTTYNVTVR
ncbi:MAG TPA: molybdopterin-dependent oxidoreductase [Candidatus Kapabacteria bacterium]|nr:molybdopterin-dependent oxidoreductase [Candidatus Kapabacteria bacterium]